MSVRRQRARRGDAERFTYSLIVTAEEAEDMIAIAIFLGSIVEYLARLFGLTRNMATR